MISQTMIAKILFYTPSDSLNLRSLNRWQWIPQGSARGHDGRLDGHQSIAVELYMMD